LGDAGSQAGVGPTPFSRGQAADAHRLPGSSGPGRFFKTHVNGVAGGVVAGTVEPDGVGAGGDKVELVVQGRTIGQFGAVAAAAQVGLGLQIGCARVATLGRRRDPLAHC
jgi:hypothetical protein